ncbi:MAG: ATP synthase F1 subunit delta [Alphaproteobacteria bacterium]
MSASSLDTQEVAKRYGKALLEISNSANELESTLEDAQNLKELIDNNEEVQQIIRSPLFSKEDQILAMEKILGLLGTGEAMKGFVHTICDNRRSFILGHALSSFIQQVEEYKGIQPVTVRSAKELSNTQQENLRQALERELNKQIRLNLVVEPELKGGLSLEIGSTLIDNTLKTKLDRYHLAMKGNA